MTQFSKVFDGQTADGNSDAVTCNGGEFEVIVEGTFGSGTATLQAKYADVGEWVPVQNGAWTSSEVRLLRLTRRCELRFALSGSTSPNLNAYI